MKYIKTYEVSKEYEEKAKLLRYYTLLIGISLNQFLTTVSDGKPFMESTKYKVKIFLNEKLNEVFCIDNYLNSITVYVYKKDHVEGVDEKILEYINDIFQKYSSKINTSGYSTFCVYELNDFTQMKNLVTEIDNLENYNVLLDAEKYNL